VFPNWTAAFAEDSGIHQVQRMNVADDGGVKNIISEVIVTSDTLEIYSKTNEEEPRTCTGEYSLFVWITNNPAAAWELHVWDKDLVEYSATGEGSSSLLEEGIPITEIRQVFLSVETGETFAVSWRNSNDYSWVES